MSEAIDIVEGAIEKAEQLGIKISIAVCDAGGRLKAFQRMDGATWAGTFGSQGKALASVAFGRSTAQLAERADTPTIRGIIAAEGNHMIPGQGGVPIIRSGVVEGACGVGGGTAEEDEACARAGVSRIVKEPLT